MDADLHTHTTASDGTLTPDKQVQLARDIGLMAIGITDHDSLNGITEALAAGERYGVEVVPGVELSTDCQGREVHILGYYPEREAPELTGMLDKLREARRSRGKLIVDKLVSLGLQIELERVWEIAGAGAIGRPHIAQALEEKGYVRSIKEAFERYIGSGAPAYVPRFKLSPEDAITLVTRARGIPVLAHPGLVDLDALIPDWVKAGLKGIEVFHTDHNQAQETRYARLAENLGLLVTGGSDYHGPGRKTTVGLGDRRVPMDNVTRLKQVKQELNCRY
ncbi:MAG TPA: PHP domain-containing protein [Desulfobacteria bacterium]|nr:PHP domain-containing protein [Desulfobacteria bacterium]